MKSLALAALLALGGNASALTGNEWLALGDEAAGKMAKTSYLRAAMDAEFYWRPLYSSVSAEQKRKAYFLPFCSPTGATVEQADRIVAVYLSEHPQHTHMEFLFLMRVALAKAWPC